MSDPQVIWHDVRPWGQVEGKGWPDTEHYFDRLPARARQRVRQPVWDLSRHSAGMCLRFTTDATRIHARYDLRSAQLSMAHMPATGCSGLDLYAADAEGVERWVGVTAPGGQRVEATLADGLSPGRRHCTLYLPLYNGVEALEIGVPAGASLAPSAPRAGKPVAFYGTSIMHGACASRPGMAIPAILGRRLGRPTLNLGFSGNGRMEPEVADLLAELDPCAYVVDCLPNTTAAEVRERAAALVRRLRQSHLDTPVLLVEDRTYANARFFPALAERQRDSRAALRAAWRELADGHVHYLSGDGLLPVDGEATVDGSHPTDLGMVAYADAFEPALRAILSDG